MKTSCKTVHVLFPSGGLSGNCRKKELKDERSLIPEILYETQPLCQLTVDCDAHGKYIFIILSQREFGILYRSQPTQIYVM